jgi:hypothetical protein
VSTKRTWGPYLLVMAGAALGLGAIALGEEPWIGGVIVGAALLTGALLRLWTSDRRAGALVSRSRGLDALTLAALGVALVLGSLSLLLDLHAT